MTDFFFHSFVIYFDFCLFLHKLKPFCMLNPPCAKTYYFAELPLTKSNKVKIIFIAPLCNLFVLQSMGNILLLGECGILLCCLIG